MGGLVLDISSKTPENFMSSPKTDPNHANELTSRTNKTFYQSKINPLKVAEEFHPTR